MLRASGSTEFREQWNDVQREALLTLRSVLDHYIERLEEEPRREQRIEEIRID